MPKSLPFALLYISRNAVPDASREQEIARILEVSLRHNRAHSVTGALVSTQAHYAQVLEGPREAVLALMARINADPRHRDVSIMAEEILPQRSFPRWSLAHIGNCDRLEEAIGRLASDAQASQGAMVWPLWQLMSELAYAQFKSDPTRST